MPDPADYKIPFGSYAGQILVEVGESSAGLRYLVRCGKSHRTYGLFKAMVQRYLSTPEVKKRIGQLVAMPVRRRDAIPIEQEQGGERC